MAQASMTPASMTQASTGTALTQPPRPNHYGRLAWQHTARYLPDHLAQIPDPTGYFADLGEQVASEIEALTPTLAGPPPPGEEFAASLGRVRMARLMAEEKVLAEMVFLTPSADPDDAPRDPTGAYLGHDPQMSPMWVPLWDGGDPDPEE